MANSTIYDIRLKYTADDSATRKVNALAGATERASRSAFDLNRLLMGIGVGSAFFAGKRLLIDYNNQIQKMKIGMGTVISMQMKKPFTEARREADILVSRLQQVAKKSPATTENFVQMANQIAPMVAMMGGGIDKIEKLATGGMTAALATGTRQDIAGLDIKQMLAGTVTQRDMLANQLIAAKGMSQDDFNKMSAVDRAKFTESALEDPALKKAADEFGESFAGVTSTFKDQMQIAFGEVGLPLMKDITKEVKTWNVWIEKNPAKIADFGRKLTATLHKGFEFVKSVADFFVKNSDTLITIAKSFLIFKGGQIVGASLNAITTGLNTFGKGLLDARAGLLTLIGRGGESGGGLVKGFMGLMGALGPVTIALGALAGVAYGLFKVFGAGKEQEERANRSEHISQFINDRDSMIKRRRQLETEIRDMGLPGMIGDSALQKRKQDELDAIRKQLENTYEMKGRDPVLRGAAVDDAKLLRSLRDDSPFMKNVIREDLSGFDKQLLINTQNNAGGFDAQQTGHLIEVLEDIFTRQKFHTDSLYKLAHPEIYPDELDSSMPGTEWRDPQTNPGKPEVNITIQKIEVASEDPDRFVHGLTKAVDSISKNPTQAKTVLAGGF